MSIEWNDIKFRASSWGELLTEPQSKADKDAGKLSVSCQKALIKIYNQEVYGRKKDITTKQMDKGIICEPEAIQLFSLLEGRMYYKNDEELENEWFKGHPDIGNAANIRISTVVNDIKCSWDLDSFMAKLLEDADKAYVAQLNVYYDLTGAQGGNIIYCLVSAPPQIINQEMESLQYRMAKNTEKIDFLEDYEKAAKELRNLMVFEDIDPRERVIKIPVPRNDELIEKMKQKVPVMRNWLYEFHKKHMALYPKEELV
jgi:hypothetical protein